MRAACILAVAGAAACASVASAQSLTALASFGSTGWRAPHVIQPGDSAGSNNGVRYNYLGDRSVVGTNDLERSFAYNPVTGNLVLVSRSAAGNGIRILNGTSGNDLGAVAQGSGIISSGNFLTNCVAVAPNGGIYVSNLQVGVNATPFKVYGWTGEGAAAPTTFFSSAQPGGVIGNFRLGDSLAISKDGSTLAAGYQTNGSAVGVGYITINTSTAMATARSTFAPAVTNNFRLGLTFGAASTDVLGKSPTDTLRITEYVTNTSLAAALTGAGEVSIAHAMIAGVPYLAAIDVNSSLVRVYDLSNPALPTIVASGNNTSGLVTSPAGTAVNGNGNATGSVQWGAIDNANQTATLYAMSSNQGIQAFTFVVPTPASSGMLVMAGVFAARRRRR